MASPSGMSTVYLITGANRGIGFHLARLLSARSNDVVFAASRDPSTASDLVQLAKERKNLHLIKITSGDVEDNRAAAKLVAEQIGRVDVVIANAGIAKGSAPIAKEDPAIFAENFHVNVLGPLVLFQAFIDLLGKSQRDLGPAFVVVSTLAASLTIQPNLAANPISAYATSKAAVNMVVRRIQVEHPDIIALELHPGLVKTDMGQASGFDLEAHGAIEPQESAEGLIKVIDGADKSKSGAFLDWNGNPLPW